MEPTNAPFMIANELMYPAMSGVDLARSDPSDRHKVAHTPCDSPNAIIRENWPTRDDGKYTNNGVRPARETTVSPTAKIVILLVIIRSSKSRYNETSIGMSLPKASARINKYMHKDWWSFGSRKNSEDDSGKGDQRKT
jgi:hypothetical protein